MKKKKLNALNIFGGGINSDVALSRNEMKKIMAGSGCTPGNDCTNCVICQNSYYCTPNHVIPPGPGCSYGICDKCPQY